MLKYKKSGIVWCCKSLQFYLHDTNKLFMVFKLLLSELKWGVLALVLSLVLVESINTSTYFRASILGVPQTFFGLNLFLEILVFFVFNTFVVFGIKGFFEMYSQKFANVIMFISGILLTGLIFILCFQVLSLE